VSTFDERGGTKWDRAARYLKIAQVLRAHGDAGISAVALADQVGVSKRTVYRDLEAMDLDAGLPIWNDKGRFGLDADAFLPPLALTLHEAMAFFLAARLLTKATDELDTEIIGVFVKLAQVLPPVLAEQLHETADAFADTPVDETFTRVLRGLTQALADRRIVEMDYEAGVYDPSKPVRRVRLHPYAIEPSAHTRALYVIGWDEEREARRTFKVERIQSVALTAETFPSPGESVSREMLDAWDVIGDDTPVEVVMRFDPSVTQRVHETRWHSSQVEELEDDGSLLWRARVSGVLEIRSWILGWGPAAEVLEPDELREWVAQQHAAAVARYDDRRG
jgi:predicted DNA-binding transcriptional regulator YafY